MELVRTRVLIAEDNDAVRFGIRRLLERAGDIEITGEAKDGLEALRLVVQLKPDVLLLDVEMPRMNGIEVARRLKYLKDSTRILALSSYDDLEYIKAMLSNGAAGYLVKDEAPDKILEAVRRIAQGETGWLSQKVKARLNKPGG
jgi:DNA-binding NarL/FixJ family response regulator